MDTSDISLSVTSGSNEHTVETRGRMKSVSLPCEIDDNTLNVCRESIGTLRGSVYPREEKDNRRVPARSLSKTGSEKVEN